MSKGAADAATASGTSKTCETCGLSVLQPPGTRRTICPGCGNFYNADVAKQVRVVQNGRMRNTDSANLRERYTKMHRERHEKAGLVDNKTEKEENNGPLGQRIANFFNNLGGKKKSAEQRPKDRSSPESVQLPDINQSGRLTASNGGSTQSSRRSTPHSPRPPDNPKSYPERLWTCDQLKQFYRTAKENNDWNQLHNIFSTTFESFIEINALFKEDPQTDYATISESGIKFDLLFTLYEILIKAPSDLQKAVLKAIINCLLKDKRLSDQTRMWPHSKDDLRAYLILSLNPLFVNSTTYVIFAHLLRQIAALSDHDHHFLVHWYRGVSVAQFKALVNKLTKFITTRLFPSSPTEVPPMSKCHWWIPSCSKTQALLSAANNLGHPPIIPHTEFYNEALNNIDLFHEYNTWQSPTQHGGFSFCQYPFMLTITAKRFILQKDSEQQMILQARKTLVTQVQQKQAPEIDMLFLSLNVRRKHLVADSLTEIAKNKTDLKKKLKVRFVGEPGLDLGGLTKEWFLLLARELFKPEHGMFIHDKVSGTYWFSMANRDKKQKEFNLVGVLMGLAVYNGINLDISLPFVAYKKLLSPAVVPCNNPNATVGVLPSPSISDLQSALPDMASSFTEVLEYGGDIEDLCLTFQASLGQHGRTFTEDLKPGGAQIDVTNENKKEYLDLHLDWIINRSIYAPFRAFYHGFHSVCASNALLGVNIHVSVHDDDNTNRYDAVDEFNIKFSEPIGDPSTTIYLNGTRAVAKTSLSLALSVCRVPTTTTPTWNSTNSWNNTDIHNSTNISRSTASTTQIPPTPVSITSVNCSNVSTGDIYLYIKLLDFTNPKNLKSTGEPCDETDEDPCDLVLQLCISEIDSIGCGFLNGHYRLSPGIKDFYGWETVDIPEVIRVFVGHSEWLGVNVYIEVYDQDQLESNKTSNELVNVFEFNYLEPLGSPSVGYMVLGGSEKSGSELELSAYACGRPV